VVVPAVLVHRIRLPGRGRPRHRPVDRAPRQTAEPRHRRAGQGELFATWRHQAVFTDTPLTTLAAETSHRAHAIIEQVIADLRAGPLAHTCPRGHFWANSASLVRATIAFNLTRAAGTLASAFHAKATTAAIRAHLISVPARVAHSTRRLVLHLPDDGPGSTPGRRRTPPPART
jgi:hypothetical protein